MVNDTPFNSLRPASQPYEFDHFSGSQIGIYVGDVFVDEINRIEFNIQQSKKPIYGYASQYYDAMASGQVIVTGSFTINFKEAGYMHLILKRYQESIDSGGSVSPLVTAPEDKNKSKILRQNIERMLSSQNKQPTSTTTGSGIETDQNPTNQPDEFSFYNDLAALGDTEFENVAEVFEDALWRTNNPEDTANISDPNSLALDRELRRADQFRGFTIWIAYGDINNAVANHTIKKITGVHIISTGQRIEINGEPIQEQYDFIAKNLL